MKDPSANHEYLPIPGFQPFLDLSARLMFGEDAKVIKEGRLVTNQTISGSGANHVGARFLVENYPFPAEKCIYLSDPTWPNHYAIHETAGFKTKTYRYYNPETRQLNFDGMYEDLMNMPDGSVVLLHAVAHNPTGVDPTEEQWRKIADVFAKKRLFAFFDSAYQGFASGEPARDAFSVRHFEERGDIAMLVAQSFAKNAGLYGERIGALHIVTGSKEQAANVQSQVNVLQRSENSTMPAYGARIVAKILGEPDLRAEWDSNIKTMAGRIMDMRQALCDLLTNEFKTPGTWNHIVDQIGMFSYLGLDKEQCQRLTKEGHIYLMLTGRVSMAGFNSSNVKHVATWIDKVVREKETKAKV